MSLCIAAGAKAMTIAVAAFTLSWTHSVEKTRWEEDWRIDAGRLVLVEGRVMGSGAGMDPPEGAVFSDGWWIYKPEIAPLQELVLAASGATVSGWRLCAAGQCTEIGAEAGKPIRLAACEGTDH